MSLSAAQTAETAKRSRQILMHSTVHTEALIIGAGPSGLFQAFELGLLGVSCQIVEAMDRPGGQCTELYPDKPIYDIPGTVFTTATDFVNQLIKQLKPFNPPIHYQQSVQQISKETAGSFVATTDSGTTFHAKKVFLATGVGAFTPVKLRVDGIDQYESTQLHYSSIDSQTMAEKNVVVIGDNDSAIRSAIEASLVARSVLLLHRKRRLEANVQTLATLQQLVKSGSVKQIKGKIIAYSGETSLQKITVLHGAEQTEFKADVLLARLGNSPKQAELDTWGIATSAKHITVDSANFETSQQGVYAVGDINTYPAKRKLILCGFHEATLAAFAATAKLRPDKPLHLQYTTTSTELQQRLGVLNSQNL